MCLREFRLHRLLHSVERLALVGLLVCMGGTAWAFDVQMGLGMANFAEDEGSSVSLEVGQGNWQAGVSYSQAYTSSRNLPVWRGYEVAMAGLGYRNPMENLTTYVRGGLLWLVDTEQIFKRDSNPGRFLLIGIEAPLLKTHSNGVLKVALEGGSMGKGAELRTGEEVGHGFLNQVLLKWAF